MNDPRQPIVFEFNDRQADLMRRVYLKVQGHTIRGKTHIATAQDLMEAKLVTMTDVKTSQPGFVVTFTSRGKEAWHNFGLKAAGRKPICLS